MKARNEKRIATKVSRAKKQSTKTASSTPTNVFNLPPKSVETKPIVPVPIQPAEPPKPPRGLIQRADGRRLMRSFLYFDEPVSKAMKKHCFERDLDISAYVNDLVRRDLIPVAGSEEVVSG